jgi:hypothetical protein
MCKKCDERAAAARSPEEYQRKVEMLQRNWPAAKHDLIPLLKDGQQFLKDVRENIEIARQIPGAAEYVALIEQFIREANETTGK